MLFFAELFQMLRIYAALIATDVMNVFAVFDWPPNQCVHDSIGFLELVDRATVVIKIASPSPAGVSFFLDHQIPKGFFGHLR